MFFGQTCMSGVWVGYGGVKTLENRSRKFNLLIFSRLPRYVYMDDILSRFKRKERGSSSSDSETSPQGKRVCSRRTKRNVRDTRRLRYGTFRCFIMFFFFFFGGSQFNIKLYLVSYSDQIP